MRAAFNARGSVNLYDFEPAVVASVLKQFLRELPDPVLTHAMVPKFERVSADPTPQKRIEGMKQLMQVRTRIDAGHRPEACFAVIIKE